MSEKHQVYKDTVVQMVTYGCESWPLKNETSKELNRWIRHDQKCYENQNWSTKQRSQTDMNFKGLQPWQAELNKLQVYWLIIHLNTKGKSNATLPMVIMYCIPLYLGKSIWCIHF